MNELENLEIIYKKLEEIGNRWIIGLRGNEHKPCKIGNLDFSKQKFSVIAIPIGSGPCKYETLSLHYLIDDSSLEEDIRLKKIEENEMMEKNEKRLKLYLENETVQEYDRLLRQTKYYL